MKWFGLRRGHVSLLAPLGIRNWTRCSHSSSGSRTQVAGLGGGGTKGNGKERQRRSIILWLEESTSCQPRAWPPWSLDSIMASFNSYYCLAKSIELLGSATVMEGVFFKILWSLSFLVVQNFTIYIRWAPAINKPNSQENEIYPKNELIVKQMKHKRSTQNAFVRK